ncbi:MAG: Maf family nucleotide pyrophosphatase [Bacteroidales bacterium]
MLHLKLQNHKLILASQSPRRRELLKGLDIDFTVAPNYEVNEEFSPAMTKDEVPVYLAKMKSEAYPQALLDNEILLTADTLVWCANTFLGKPQSTDEAIAMLGQLSGQSHEVLTGVCLRSAKNCHTFLATTQVFVRTLSKDEIAYYINQYKPYDKAGSYGVQEWLGYAAVERIDGSFYNVMGLPLQKLYVELEAFIAAL